MGFNILGIKNWTIFQKIKTPNSECEIVLCSSIKCRKIFPTIFPAGRRSQSRFVAWSISGTNAPTTLPIKQENDVNKFKLVGGEIVAAVKSEANEIKSCVRPVMLELYMQIKGKVAIVTGASKGIGLATTRLLSKNGVKTVLVSRDEEKLEELVGEIPNSISIKADMTREVEIKNMIKQTLQYMERVDILINNAGQGYDSAIEDLDLKTVRKIYELNVFGPLMAMNEVIPVMKNLGGGAIVNVASGTALMALPDTAVYSSTKSALAQISRVAAEELKKDKIKVSVVYPYVTLTEFEKNTLRSGDIEYSDEWLKFLPHPPDPPEHAAQVILEAIVSGYPEVFAHDWMKR